MHHLHWVLKRVSLVTDSVRLRVVSRLVLAYAVRCLVVVSIHLVWQVEAVILGNKLGLSAGHSSIFHKLLLFLLWDLSLGWNFLDFSGSASLLGWVGLEHGRFDLSLAIQAMNALDLLCHFPGARLGRASLTVWCHLALLVVSWRVGIAVMIAKEVWVSSRLALQVLRPASRQHLVLHVHCLVGWLSQLLEVRILIGVHVGELGRGSECNVAFHGRAWGLTIEHLRDKLGLRHDYTSLVAYCKELIGCCFAEQLISLLLIQVDLGAYFLTRKINGRCIMLVRLSRWLNLLKAHDLVWLNLILSLHFLQVFLTFKC